MLYSYRAERDGSMQLEWQVMTSERAQEVALAGACLQSCWADLVRPDERGVVEARRRRLLSGSTSVDEVSLLPVGGRDVRLRLHGRPEVHGGRVTRIIGSAEEIAPEQPPASAAGLWGREDEARLLVRELEHRLQNMLGTVQALVLQTLNASPSSEAAAEAIGGRLQALGGAQRLLTRAGWRGVLLADLIREEFAPYRPGEEGIAVSGEPVVLGPEIALALSLALHELTTNAVKYGALSVPEGRVEVAWTTLRTPPPARLVLTWAERDGPPVQAPEQRGFGHSLIEGSIGHQLGGELHVQFSPQGVRCRIEVPLPSAPPPS